jgi:arylsulfatase
VRYTQWHTTALCSPTRSCLLTGRNHTRNSMACITEAAVGFPNASGTIPPENGMVSEILGERGWNTYSVGKWHLCPTVEMNLASNRRNWPTGRGFERFYGFLGAETNQWHPDLVYDNHPVDQPKPPEEGYHFTEDITDKALEFIKDAKAIAPDKPFFLHYAPGAAHAPHHAPREWIERYAGKFDMGYEALREQTLARQKEMGIVPADTELPPLNPIGTPQDRTGPGGLPFPPLDYTKPWDSLSADEKRLFARMAEVYAGFLSHADHHIGRLLDFLEETWQADNTLVILVSDNGASGEGGPDGSVNETLFFNGVPDDLQRNLAMIDELGGPKTYNHYCTGWAMAFNTPFKMWKRYEFNGGTSDPCILSWPSVLGHGGEIRHQYHHAIDIVPTIRDLLEVTPPETIKGHVQVPFDGVSMRYSVGDPSAPSARRTQFYSMLGSRAIWHDGWKAVTTHPTISGWSHFNDDTWELYHTDVDRSELHDLAAEHPDKVRELVNLWFAEAGANKTFPLDDRSALEILLTPRPQLASPRHRYVYYPDVADVPGIQAVSIRNRSYTIGALVNIPAPGAEGVLFAHGARFGGHALYVKDNRLHYVYSFVGMFEQRVDAAEDLPTGENLIVSASFDRDGEDPPGVAAGILSLYHGDRKVGEARIKTQPGNFELAGEGLCVGRDSGAAVTDDYPGQPPYRFTGGTVKRVAIDVSGDPYLDLEREAAAMLARE